MTFVHHCLRKLLDAGAGVWWHWSLWSAAKKYRAHSMAHQRHEHGSATLYGEYGSTPSSGYGAHLCKWSWQWSKRVSWRRINEKSMSLVERKQENQEKVTSMIGKRLNQSADFVNEQIGQSYCSSCKSIGSSLVVPMLENSCGFVSNWVIASCSSWSVLLLQ